MEEHGYSADVARENDSAMRATVVYEVASAVPHLFSHGGNVLAAPVALQSKPLLVDLMKVGLFSMNLDSASSFERRSGTAFPADRISSFILGMAVLYAIEVAPTENSAEDPPVVSLDALNRHVRRIEAAFGEIPVDLAMISQVTRIANVRLTMDAPSGSGVQS